MVNLIIFTNSSVVYFDFLLLGALSRIWAVTVVSPLELVRTKMQSQKMAFYQVTNFNQSLVLSTTYVGKK